MDYRAIYRKLKFWCNYLGIILMKVDIQDIMDNLLVYNRMGYNEAKLDKEINRILRRA